MIRHRWWFLLFAVALATAAVGVGGQSPSETQLEIRTSRIPHAGNGVFAKAAIPKGAVLGAYTGEFIADEEYQRRLAADKWQYMMGLLDCAKPHTGGITTIDGINGNVFTRMNFAPAEFQNVKFEKICEAPFVKIIALRDIAAGEELWVDYGPRYVYDFMNDPAVSKFFADLRAKRGPSDAPADRTAPQLAAVDVSAVEHLRPAQPNIPDRSFSLADFGGVGDGRTLNTDAFQRGIAAVGRAGGGRLIVPKGVFVTGPFKLCSNLDLHLEEGAVIKAPETFASAGLPDPAGFKTQAEADASYHVPDPLITGSRLHDVAITGPGTIDGSGQHWWAWSERAMRNAAAQGKPGRVVYRRPHLVVINGCERLRVADVMLTNSSMFHLVPKNITDLTIERVKVRAPWDGSAPNTDAIDPGPGTNFWIHDCDLDTGDDDIVIKSGGTNVLIENNTIKHGHGISIGSETTAGVHTMLVRNCTMDGTDNGIRIKSMRGAGGIVQNVRYTNIRMRNVANAIVLQLDYVDNNRPDFKGDPAKIPSIRDVLIDHVTVEASRNAGMIHGLPDSRITNITLRDVTISAEIDLDIRDADSPVFERVTRTIRPRVTMPAR